MKAMLGLFAVLILAGCGEQAGRYQLMARGEGLFRLDTKTGEIAACGPEAFANPPKFYCLSFPDTRVTK